MERRTKGRLAEAHALVWFSEHGYEVYTPFHDNTKYDLIVQKDNILSRVSVKYCSTKTHSGAWQVTMKNVSRRKDDVSVSKFNSNDFDLIAVYLEGQGIVVVPANQATPNILTISN